MSLPESGRRLAASAAEVVSYGSVTNRWITHETENGRHQVRLET